MERHSIRFEDAALQDQFINELRRQRVPFTLTAVGAVECPDSDWDAVNSVAHKIRDSRFPWYFSWLNTREDSERFLQALRIADLPFELEHHEDRDVFLLPRADKSKHAEVLARAFDEE